MRFEGFRVTNFRNVLDSGWIPANRITAFVGQNEAGKSNLFEALYCLNPIDDATYDLDEDWPVDKWDGRKEAKGKLVCQANFTLSTDDITALFDEAAVAVEESDDNEGGAGGAAAEKTFSLPSSVTVTLNRWYGYSTGFSIRGFTDGVLDDEKAKAWAKANVPKFVYIRDYEMSGAQIELDQLKQRLDNVGGQRHRLSHEGLCCKL